MMGHDVRFLTGTDEHGLKVQRAAEARGVEPQQLADEVSESFRSLFDQLGLSYARFIRTTDEDHRSHVEEMVRRMDISEDLYKGTYAGWYSASDEAYYDESEIADGVAVATGSSVEWVEEESYFFRLSKYQDRLLEWYTENPDFILPESRKNEVISFVKGGLQDLSVSRTSFDWGIPWPQDPKHVLYVWMDALTSYLTGSDGWPVTTHIIGKDILRFHAVYWPAFLMSAGHALPEHIVAHGWWLKGDVKMGKSRGNAIDPAPLIENYGATTLRYYLIRETPVSRDGRFSEDRMVSRYNAELAHNVGNLVTRTFSMVRSYLASEIPANPGTKSNKGADLHLQKRWDATLDEYQLRMGRYEFHKALVAAMSFSRDVNGYLQDTKPWKLSATDNGRLVEVIYRTLDAIKLVASLLCPFIPEPSYAILAAMGISNPNLEWGSLPRGPLGEYEVPFPRIEE